MSLLDNLLYKTCLLGGNTKIDIILNFTDKYSREKKKGFYDNDTNKLLDNKSDNDYCDVVKKTKKAPIKGKKVIDDRIGKFIYKK